MHLDDVVDLLALVVRRRSTLPAETVLLVGEPETLSYGDLQRELGQLIHGEAWRTRAIPKWTAKLGARAQATLPLGARPFIKPWIGLVAGWPRSGCGRPFERVR